MARKRQRDEAGPSRDPVTSESSEPFESPQAPVEPVAPVAPPRRPQEAKVVQYEVSPYGRYMRWSTARGPSAPKMACRCREDYSYPNYVVEAIVKERNRLKKPFEDVFTGIEAKLAARDRECARLRAYAEELLTRAERAERDLRSFLRDAKEESEEETVQKPLDSAADRSSSEGST